MPSDGIGQNIDVPRLRAQHLAMWRIRALEQAALRGMDEKEYEALIAKRELHGLVLAMSTDTITRTDGSDIPVVAIVRSTGRPAKK